jgi:hypothetical protein
VNISGSSSTSVFIGQPFDLRALGGLPGPAPGYSTEGIQADVSVDGAASLNVDYSLNVLSPGGVTVTSSTISGIGLFGANSVTISNGDVAVTSVLWKA